MRRRMISAASVLGIALLAIVAAIPVAAHMRAGSGFASVSQPSSSTISMAQAKTDFEQYLRQQGYDNLGISEVMQFSNQFYAEAVDATTGAGAFELVMSLDGQFVTPEPGPTMMWNLTYSPMFGGLGAGLRQGMTGYGMMGASRGFDMMGNAAGSLGPGMMRGYGMPVDAASTPGNAGSCYGGAAMGYHPETAAQLDEQLTAAAAQTRVQTWLDQNRPGVMAADATAFPGYSTFHTEQNGKIIGMLSIQSSTGAIWEHVWHGDFVAMEPAP